MPMTVTLYAGLLGLMAIGIGFPIGQLRGKLKVSLGDGGDQRLLLAIRRHGNFMEWVPFALLLIALLESNGVSKLAVHFLGAGLVLARLCHAMGLRHDSIEGVGRLVGATGTALIIVVASIWLLVRFAAG